jgi:hypothetical protein
MRKALAEMMWPVENYTDKIHSGVKFTLQNYSHLSFTLKQLRPYLESGYPWLKNPNANQSVWLDQIIKTGLLKLIQLGKVKRVTSKVSVEQQWQWATAVASSGYTNITSDSNVAQTEDAKKAVERRAVGGRSLWLLNSKPKLGVLHA